MNILILIIIIIIIKSLINSAAFKNSDALQLQAYVIQCYGTGVPSDVVQKLPSTVTKDASRLVGCSKCLDRKQQSFCDRRLWLSVAYGGGGIINVYADRLQLSIHT